MSLSTATKFGTDCQLMLHMDGADASTTFTDSELNTAKTFTAHGDAQIDTAQSKFGGASGLFDGTGDYIDGASGVDWGTETGDYQLDLQVRFNSVASSRTFFGMFVDANNGWRFWWSSSNLLRITAIFGGSTTVDVQCAWAPSTNTWYHVAFVRTGTNYMIFVDGTQVGATSTNSVNLLSFGGTITIGSWNSADQMNGWLDELRWVKGLAVWTANFTAPSAAYAPYGIKLISGVSVSSNLVKKISSIAIASVNKVSSIG